MSQDRSNCTAYNELCLALANEAIRKGGNINESVIKAAEAAWLEESLSSDWAVIESSMNARETRAGRKNQVLFALGVCDKEDFRYTDVERIVRAEFPRTTRDITLNVNQILTGLEQLPSQLIRRTARGDAYRFVSPKIRIAIRTGLIKTSSETVEKARI